VKGVFLADGSEKGFRRFGAELKKTHLVVQNLGTRLGILEIGEKYHPSST
jgi:hypothetical protein